MENENFVNVISDNLEFQLDNLPELPGCYLMKDNNEGILYIGKSKNLKNRVKSYFRNKSDLSPRIKLMIKQVCDIEIIVTDNEAEALTLESNLIKNKQPFYNILLKDDKKYPYICITWSEDYPRIFITRRRRQRNIKDKFYGPYVDVYQLRETLFNIKRVFPLRQRSIPLYKDRTCLNYSIGRCPGVCQQKISIEDYRNILRRVEMIFQGRTEELKNLLLKKIDEFCINYAYEEAAIIRDQIKGLNQFKDNQKMIIPDSSISRDIFGIYGDNKLTCIQIFQMRSGKLVNRLGYITQTLNKTNEIIIQLILEEHYSNVQPVEIPSEILIRSKLPNQKFIVDWLTEIKGYKVNILNPKRSKNSNLITLVEKNASIEFEKISKGKDKQNQYLEDLAQLLDLSKLPRRIEGYDISHIQGSNTVASQVVFIDGIPAKNDYRKYIIKNPSINIGHSDDFLSIQEVIKRRFRRWSNYKKDLGSLEFLSSVKSSKLDLINISDWPDLILIDGGKGQLNAAIHALKELDLEDELKVISLAKKREEIFAKGIPSPLEREDDQPALILLRKLRDEAHRFAISFHRDRRSLQLRRSQLTEIPGLGPKRIKDLLCYFRSINAIKLATIEDLVKVPGLGKESAKQIWSYFNPKE